MKTLICLVLAAVAIGLVIFLAMRPAQQPANRRAPPEEATPTAAQPYLPPKGYVCYRATKPIIIDGKLDDEAWAAAPWSDDFVDIEEDKKPNPRFRTRVKMLW